jgi:hypothetical protein
MARRSSTAAKSGACIGNVAMPEACWIAGDGVGDLVILQDRERFGERSLLVIEKGLRRIRDDLHIDARRIHVVQSPRHVPTAPRKRPITASRDLEHSEVVVDAFQPAPTFGASFCIRLMVSTERMWA